MLDEVSPRRRVASVNMTHTRWWDVAAVGVLAVIAVIAIPDAAAFAAFAPALVAVAIAIVGLGYIFLTYPAARAGRSTHFVAFASACAVAMLIGNAGSPFVALATALVNPICWLLAPTRRGAVFATIAMAVGITVGTLISSGLNTRGLFLASMTGGLVGAFSIGIGLWLRSVMEYGVERDRLISELTAAQAEVEVLSRERGAAEARERIARDLHDTVTQTLAGLVILAERGSRQAADGRIDAATETMSTVENLARDALREARELVVHTAAVSSETALADALGRLTERFRVEVGFAVDLRLDVDAPVDRETQIVLLRCLQEALANVRKHADAGRVEVEVRTSVDGSASLTVADDGRGFDPATARAGFGLDGMRERVALAGGDFDVVTRDGGGTALTVSLPGPRQAGTA